MASIGDLVVRIVGDNSGLDAAVDGSERKVDAFSKTITKIGLAIAGVFSARAIIQGIQRFGLESVASFKAAELSAVNLAAGLRSVGEYTPSLAEEMSRFAGSLQKVTRYGDEEISNVEALLMELGQLDAVAAMKATPAVLDLASALGIDLDSAAQMVGKAMAGSVEGLNRYGIKIDSALTGSARFDAILAALNDRFGGLAIAAGETGTASIVKLGNAFDDFKEQVGRGEVSVFKPLLDWLTGLAEKATTSLKAVMDLKDAQDKLANGVATVADQLTVLQAKYDAVSQRIDNYKGKTMDLGDVLLLNNDIQLGFVKNIDEEIVKLQGQKTALGAAIGGLMRKAQTEKEAAEASAAAAEALEKHNKAIAETVELLNQNPTPGLLSVVTEFKTSLADIADGSGQVVKGIVDISDALEDLSKKQHNATEKTTGEIKDATGKWKADYQDYFSYASQLANTFADLNSALLDQQLEDLDAQLQQALEDAGVADETRLDSLADQLADAQKLRDSATTEEEKADAQQRIDDLKAEMAKEKLKENIAEAFAKRKAQIEYNAAVSSWNLSLAQAVSDAALAIIRIWASAEPLWAKVAESVLVGGITAVQIAAITANKPQPPALAEGGIALPRPGGHLVRVAEAGEAELIAPLSRLGDLLSQQRAPVEREIIMPLTVQVGPDKLYEGLYRASKNRLLLIDGGAVVP